MKTLNKIGIDTALVGSTLAFSTLGISSAQAAVLGTFDITGTSRIVDFEQIIFSNARVEDTAPLVNDFTPLANTNVVFSPIALTNPVFDGVATTTFTGNVDNPFMKFTAAPDLTFTADNPFPVTLVDLTDIVSFAAAPINGTFTNANGVSTGTGVATFNYIDTFGSFSLTLKATPIPVPEPTTTLGLAALGLVAFFSKSMAKKKKQQVSA